MGKLTERKKASQEQENYVENKNNDEVPNAGKYSVGVSQEDDGRLQKDSNNHIEIKDNNNLNNDNIEVVNGDGKGS